MGRRTAKINLSSKRIKRFLWDGNVPLHEWEYDLSERPNLSRDKDNLLVYDKEEPITENLITWVFAEGSFVPCAKLVNGESFSIISDHLGTPYEAYDEERQKVWSAEYEKSGIKDIWGTDYRSHHVSYDPETNKMIMQIVHNDYHKIDHTGGAKQFKEDTGFKYGTPETITKK